MIKPTHCASNIDNAIRQLKKASVQIQKGMLTIAENDISDSIINIGKALHGLEELPLKKRPVRKKILK
jgi:hypothetical protein